MNEIQIFNNPEFGEVRTMTDIENKTIERLMKLDEFSLLALAVDYALDEKKEEAWIILHYADRKANHDDGVYIKLRTAVGIMVAISKTKIDEYHYHALFRKYFNRVLGDGAEIVYKRSDGKNIPDAWIRMDGEDIPVEIKKNSFNAKALQQLQRYMKAYQCNKGIAVGRDIKIDLPSNILFISLERLEAEHE